MFLKEFKFQNFNNDLTKKEVSIIASQKKNKILIKIILSYENSESKISFKIGENTDNSIKWGNEKKIIFHDLVEFNKLFENIFVLKMFDVNKLKESYKDWEIIDFR